MACSLNVPDMLFSDTDMTPRVAHVNPYELLHWLQDRANTLRALAKERFATRKWPEVQEGLFAIFEAEAMERVIVHMVEINKPPAQLGKDYKLPDFMTENLPEETGILRYINENHV